MSTHSCFHGQIVAPRSYDYVADERVSLGISQFASPGAAKKYKDAFAEVPLDFGTNIQKGPIIYSVSGGTDAERQRVISALQ